MRRIKARTGLSLIEVLIALVILLFVSLSVMQTALVVIDSNTKNDIRDEAVNVVSMKIDRVRNIPYDTLMPSITDQNYIQGINIDTACTSGDCITNPTNCKYNCPNDNMPSSQTSIPISVAGTTINATNVVQRKIRNANVLFFTRSGTNDILAHPLGSDAASTQVTIRYWYNWRGVSKSVEATTIIKR